MKRLLLIALFGCLIYACGDTTSNKTERELTTSATSDTIATYTWTTELCENKGTYNPQKYSAEQLQNTYDLWCKYTSIMLETDGTVFKIEDVSKLSVDKLTEEYKKKKEYFIASKIVETAFWINLKKQELQELEDEYELKKISIEAYANPAVLLNNRFTKNCVDFAKALNTKDTLELLSFWKAFSEKQRVINGFPEKYLKRFNEEYNSPQKLEYARVELMTFGWWNCANGYLIHTNRDTKMEEEFNKLFLNITSKCDEEP